MLAALDAIRAAALRLLREGKVHPQLVVLAAARIAGELGAGAALAGGMEVETLLGELAEVVRLTGREHAETLRDKALLLGRNARPQSQLGVVGDYTADADCR